LLLFFKKAGFSSLLQEPPSMRQIILAAPGGPEVMQIVEAERPVPKAGEVLIQVEAAGVNRPDVQQRKGLYPPPPDASPVLGLEVAGVVVEVGDGVTTLHPGDRVCALVNGGGYAEFATAPAGQCLPWPHGYDAVRAAALPENYFTVWANLFIHGRLARGESVLVHGGSSGIGTTAIQLARASGATVYATAGSAEKCAVCERLGATKAIDYKSEDFVERIRALTGKRGVDVVLDIVGGPYLSRNISILARDGRLVVVAVQGGTKDPEFDLRHVMVRRLTITGSTMRPRSAAEKAGIAASLLEHAWPLLENGTCAPVIHAVFPLDQVADAHRLMESSAHIGKIMLTL
jgi:putative PIG3 family NAD(P)H quinone oxidoreductase